MSWKEMTRNETSWKNFIGRRVIASRRRGLATATLYGLSLAVRFTSATGEEVEIPARAMNPTYPVASIMNQNGSGLSYQGWDSRVQSVVFRQGWSSSSPLSRCIAP